MKRIMWIFIPISILCLGTVTVASKSGDAGQKPQPKEWTVPDCEHVAGTPYFTYTTDEGLSFIETSILKGMALPQGLAALDSPNTLLGTSLVDCGEGNCNLLFRSVDAGCHWAEIGQIPVSFGLHLVAAQGGQAYAWNSGQNLFFWFDGQEIHERTAPGYMIGFAVNPDNAAHIRVGTTYGQLYESFDYGEQYSALGEPISDWQTYWVVAFDPENWDNALCGGSSGGYRTTDAGGIWQPIVSFDPEQDLVYNFVYSTGGQQRVWARARLRSLPVPENCLMVSEDGGEHFVPVVNSLDSAVDQFGITRPVILVNTPVWAVHPLNSNVLYFMYCMYVDGYGTDFFRYDLSTDQLSVTHTDGLDGIGSIAFNPVDPGVMYVGLDQEIRPYPNMNATSSAGADMTMGVSPNPFNPSTELSFSLPEAAQVKLYIYNLVGQKVATVVDAYMNAGQHTVSWDASRFASGIYLARLEAGSFAETRKMVLLK